MPEGGACRRGWWGEGHRAHRGDCRGYQRGYWKWRKRGGGFDSANAILNSPPGDVPVIDNVRPLDRKPFARSVTKFMKVSSALMVDNCRWERQRKRKSARRSRAYGRTCARCLLIRALSLGTCSARFYTGVMSKRGRIIQAKSRPRIFSEGNFFPFEIFSIFENIFNMSKLI